MSSKKLFTPLFFALLCGIFSIGSFTVANAAGGGCDGQDGCYTGPPSGGGFSGGNANPSAITPTTASVGVPVTLSSIITDSGSVATNYQGEEDNVEEGSATYYDSFQISTDGGNTFTNMTGNILGTTLAAGASAPLTTTYTFTSGGIYYVRAVGDVTDVIYNDLGAAGNPQLGETTKGDAGPWTAITVPSATPTAQLSANPTSIQSGGTSVLYWSSTNTTSCTGINFSTGGATTGSVSVSPGSTTNYSLSCSGTGGTATANATVSVAQLPVLDGTTGGVATTILNQAVSLTGTAYNAGSGAAGDFPNVINVCDGNCATINTLIATQDVGSLSSGATSGTLTASYAPATLNQLYYRFCANMNTSGSHVATQASYPSNCGNWQYLNVQPPVPAAPTNLTTTCNADGTSVNFSWTPSQYATLYYPRMYAPTTAQCNAYGWQLWTGDYKTCYPNPDTDTQTSFANFPITPGQSYSWWVQAGNSSGVDATAPTANFSCSGTPNITDVTGSAANATISQPVTLSGTAMNTSTNGGTGAAGDFPNIVQICDANCATLNQSIAANDVSSLALGSSAPVSASYTPAKTGSLYYRVCGNENTSGTNVITESDYGDNCGNWNTLTVAYPAVGGACSVSKTIVGIGTPVTWSASASGGSGTYTYQWGSNVSGTSQSVSESYPSAGSYTGQVTISSGGQNYTAYCSPGGSSNPLTVISCTPTFTANPTSVTEGGSSVLSWSEPSMCASSCTGTGFNTGGALSGTASVVPGTLPTTSYGLTCSPQSTVYTSVGVIASGVTLTASPSRVVTGGTTSLTWTSTNTNTCSITRGGAQITGGSGTSGTKVPDPTPITSQTLYTATCTTGTNGNPGAPVTATAIVNVVPSFNEF